MAGQLTRIDRLLEQMAQWALDYRSPECHDEDLVTTIAGAQITVGVLRRAFERYFHTPFEMLPARAARRAEYEDTGGING